MMKRLILILAIIIISLKLKAAEGCLVGTTVYTTFEGYSTVNLIPLSLGTKIFNNTNYLSSITDTCPGWANVYASTGSCIYGPATLGLSLGGFQIAICAACPTGTLVDYDYTNCPLDDYTWAIALASGTLGFILIRRKIA
jgi:hypothetical protein